jgi:predicted acetyltransferase
MDMANWLDLNMLGTKPEYRRRGVASQMIKWGTNRADEEGIETFVVSAPGARAVYLKHGFELAREGEDMGDFVPWYMVRKPKVEAKEAKKKEGGYVKWLLGVSAVLGVAAIVYRRVHRRAL